jgi:hypothetical protein
MHKNRFLPNVLIRFIFLIILFASAFFSFSQTEKLNRSLNYINEQFKKFNTYNLQFQIDYDGKNLISKSIYFEVTYPINQLSSIYYTIRGDKDCKVFFKCQNDDQCISSLNINDSSTDLKSEYSFNLETSPDITEKVVMEFLEIKKSINNLNTVTEQTTVANNSNLNSDIEYINKMLKKYNSFNIQFSIDPDKKVLKSSSAYFEITYNPSTIYKIDLINRGENDYKINFTCKPDVTCLTSVDLRNQNIEMINNYPVNFTGNAEEAQKMINTFNQILQNLNK